MTNKLVFKTDGEDKSIYTAIGIQPPAGWTCYLFGNKPGEVGMVYMPREGMVPNAFVRWMMKICLGCTWVKEGK